MECQMNRTLKGCKRRVSSVYLLIRYAIFKICWHPYQGVRGFGFGFRGIAALNQRLKAGIPSGFGSNRRNQKGQLKNRR